MNGNPTKKIEKHKGKDKTYTVSALPYIVAMGPTRTLTVEGTEPFALRFKGADMPDDGAGPKRKSTPDAGGKHVLKLKLRKSGALEYFEYDVLTGGDVVDPIIIIDPDLENAQ